MDKTTNGIVVGLIAGFYDVQTQEGLVRTRARGIFRNRNQRPCVGDWVTVQLDKAGTNYLIEVKPRLNQIGRPALANVSHVLLVISAVEPDFSVTLLDRFLTFFAWRQVAVSLYLSKSDLVQEVPLARIKRILNYYHKIGYPIYLTPEALLTTLSEKMANQEVWTLAGQSGAGKSTLLNRLKKDANQATGVISTSLNRGKHTTRQVQLFAYGNGYLADTPGFSAIDLTAIKLVDLADYFVEFKELAPQCKFRRCQHLKEPRCAVKAAQQSGEILSTRYDAYLLQRLEISQDHRPEYSK